MPELPEVETMKRDLEDKIVGLTIKDVEIFDKRVIRGAAPALFKKKLTGQKIDSIDRRGKAIIFHLSAGGFLVAHVGMTGYFIYGEHLRNGSDLKETKIIFTLSNGKHLNYNDHRLFGKLIYSADLGSLPYFQTIGPEPLNGTFSKTWLAEKLKTKKGPIKPLLMNQQFLAGIGNIYASEILFESGIRPQRKADRLSSKDTDLLYSKIKSVLKRAIDHRGTSMRNYRDASGNKGNFKSCIKVYARDGESCVSCGKLIAKIVQAGRSTFYCANCQK